VIFSLKNIEIDQPTSLNGITIRGLKNQCFSYKMALISYPIGR